MISSPLNLSFPKPLVSNTVNQLIIAWMIPTNPGTLNFWPVLRSDPLNCCLTHFTLTVICLSSHDVTPFYSNKPSNESKEYLGGDIFANPSRLSCSLNGVIWLVSLILITEVLLPGCKTLFDVTLPRKRSGFTAAKSWTSRQLYMSGPLGSPADTQNERF